MERRLPGLKKGGGGEICNYKINNGLSGLHPCGIVVRVPGYRFRGPDSIPSATRFSEMWVCNGVHSASRVKLRNCSEEMAAASV
jgi:hypothetical protein